MTRFTVLLSALIFVSAVPVQADQPNEGRVFGQSLMTTEEVTTHKEKLAGSRSMQERDQVEAEHKDRMVQRARWKGLVLNSETNGVSLADNN